MIVSHHLIEQLPQGDTAIALGFFDGMHRGHRLVVEKALEGKEQGLIPCVFTFVLGAGSAKAAEGLIQTPEVAQLVLERMGVEWMFRPNFESFSHMTPKEFVEEVLIAKYRAKLVCCGENFRFGKNAAGTANTLKELCAPLGVQVQVLPLLLDEGEPISSTRIRTALLEGDMPTVNRLLGHPYTLVAQIVHGAKLGRTIGCPTTNQQFAPDQIIPKNGVYATVTYLDNKGYIGATNVGHKPTVNGQELLAETYLKGFSGEVYGQVAPVEFYHYLRGEKKFGSLEELAQAIQTSAEQAVGLCQEFLR